jgi:hypothetical protein
MREREEKRREREWERNINKFVVEWNLADNSDDF